MLINISSMKIYFAGAICGGRDDAKLYEKIIAYLGGRGDVLTEHVGNIELSGKGETTKKDNEIYFRDMKWLHSADAVDAENAEFVLPMPLWLRSPHTHWELGTNWELLKN